MFDSAIVAAEQIMNKPLDLDEGSMTHLEPLVIPVSYGTAAALSFFH
jgi:hypothetical protein